MQELVDAGKLMWVMPSIASPDDDKWNLMYDALKKFGEVNGHCNVPYSYSCRVEDGSNVKLGAWLRKQREQKKKGALRLDREMKMQALMNLGLLRMPTAFSTTAGDDDQWSMMINAVEEFITKNGHCNIPLNYEHRLEDDTIARLGVWMRKQKELKRKDQLSSDRDEVLQSLIDDGLMQMDPPPTGPSDDERWDMMLDALVRYSMQFGHCNLSSTQEYTLCDGTVAKLGAWLSQQRHH
eukprot:gene2642-3198_t